MLDKFLKMLSAHGIMVIDLSIGGNDPLQTHTIEPGYVASVTLNIPSQYDSERILAAMLQAAMSNIQSQDRMDEAPQA